MVLLYTNSLKAAGSIEQWNDLVKIQDITDLVTIIWGWSIPSKNAILSEQASKCDSVSPIASWTTETSTLVWETKDRSMGDSLD